LAVFDPDYSLVTSFIEIPCFRYLDIPHENGKDCWTGADPHTEAQVAEFYSGLQTWIRATCEGQEQYVLPEYDAEKINKALKERGLGSHCKSKICRWDSKLKNTICRSTAYVAIEDKDRRKLDPRFRDPDASNHNNSTATAISARYMTILVIPTLMIVELC